MLKLPTALILQFDNLLLNKSYPDKDRAFYKKWLRFYWDFCHKYKHDAFYSDSLPLFIHKFQDKNQSLFQQNQAKQAVSLFFEMHAANEQPLVRVNHVPEESLQNVNCNKEELSHNERQKAQLSHKKSN